METIRLDYLNTFLTVAKTHSFSVAAKELKTSQGTVSHHIAALEVYFDAELFKLTANGVEVTEEGATLKETAAKIVNKGRNGTIYRGVVLRLNNKNRKRLKNNKKNCIIK